MRSDIGAGVLFICICFGLSTCMVADSISRKINAETNALLKAKQ